MSSGCGDRVKEDRYAQLSGNVRVADQRILEILKDIKNRAGMKDEVALYSSPTRLCNGISRAEDGSLRVVLYRGVFNDWSDEAVKGIIAHELGHFLAKHSFDWDLYPLEIQEEYQTEANAWAIRLVGKDALRAFLIQWRWNPRDADEAVKRAEMVALGM